QSVLPPDVGGMLGAPQEGGREMRLPDILSHMTRVWAGNPWIAGFVLREVLTPGGPMRAMFLREFPERLAPLAERALRAEMARGAIRSDLDPRLLVLSVVSLAIFPFLAFPLTSRVFGVRNDEEFVTRFLRHTQALLSSGVAPAAAAGVARAPRRDRDGAADTWRRAVLPCRPRPRLPRPARGSAHGQAHPRGRPQRPRSHRRLRRDLVDAAFPELLCAARSARGRGPVAR